MLDAGPSPLNMEAALVAPWLRRNNGQTYDWVLVVEPINVKRANAFKEKLGSTLPALQIGRRFLVIVHQKSGSQVISGSRNNGALKNDREHLEVVKCRPLAKLLN